MTVSEQIDDLIDLVNIEWASIPEGVAFDVFIKMVAAESKKTWDGLSLIAKALDEAQASGLGHGSAGA
jgi:hypothetical protein